MKRSGLFIIIVFHTFLVLPQTQTEKILQELNKQREEAQKTALFRHASDMDISQIPDVEEGDYLLTGGNVESGNAIDIRPSKKNTFTLAPDKKILIKGGNYQYISINIPSLDGTPEKPIIITNYDGKVMTQKITISGIKYYKFSGDIIHQTPVSQPQIQTIGKQPNKESQTRSQNKTIFRYATAEDTEEIQNANEGDYLLTNGNNISGNVIDIRPSKKNTFRLDNTTKQHKILIKGGDYDYIWLEIPGLEGTPENPIIITNYDGQVKTKKLDIWGIKYFRITGKFDPKNKTGDKNYLGHDEGYAYSSGKYGIWINKDWDNLGYLTKFSGVGNTPISDFEVDYVEISNGGFSNLLKWDNHPNPVKNVSWHDTYIHDVHGEGMYVGSTSPKDPQSPIINFRFYNNRVLRVGFEGIQLGQISGGCEIYNNVVHGSTVWRSPLGSYQDGAIQLRTRDGKVSVRNNVFLCAGQLWLSIFTNTPLDGYSQSGIIDISNNLFLYCRGPMGGYIGKSKDTPNLSYTIKGNYFGRFKYIYNEVYTDSKYKDGDFILRIATKCPLVLKDNVWDKNSNKTRFYQSFVGEEHITATNNNKSLVPDIEFIDYMGFPIGFDYLLYEEWASYVGKTWGNEKQFVSTGTKKGEKVIFRVGNYVSRRSRLYKCIKENTLIEPGVTEGWQQYWELISFKNSNTPPDDVRIISKSTYNKLNMGLLNNPK